MGPIEIIKAHPVISAVAVVATVGAVLLLSGGGGGDESYTTGGDGYDSNAAMQIAQYQAQQQGQALQVGASKEVALGEQATAKYLADLQSKDRAAELATSLTLGIKQLETSAATTAQTNLLAANIEGQRIKAQTDQIDAQYSSLASQMASQAAIAKASIDAQVAVARINKPSCGLFCKIFG